jgi:hypothetical protein
MSIDADKTIAQLVRLTICLVVILCTGCTDEQVQTRDKAPTKRDVAEARYALEVYVGPPGEERLLRVPPITGAAPAVSWSDIQFESEASDLPGLEEQTIVNGQDTNETDAAQGYAPGWTLLEYATKVCTHGNNSEYGDGRPDQHVLPFPWWPLEFTTLTP